MLPHLMGRTRTKSLSGWSQILEARIKSSQYDHEEIGVLLQPQYRQEAAARSGPRMIHTVYHARHWPKEWYTFDAHGFIKEVDGVDLHARRGLCRARTHTGSLVARLTSQTMRVPALVRAETYTSVLDGQFTFDTQVAGRFVLLQCFRKRGYSCVFWSQTPVAV